MAFSAEEKAAWDRAWKRVDDKLKAEKAAKAVTGVTHVNIATGNARVGRQVGRDER